MECPIGAGRPSLRWNGIAGLWLCGLPEYLYYILMAYIVMAYTGVLILYTYGLYSYGRHGFALRWDGIACHVALWITAVLEMTGLAMYGSAWLPC